jgi:KDO2-lipid IV(A) lauroyltransferase
MMTFGERLPRGKGYRLHFERLPECDFDEERMNRAIEELVRRFPDQYYWNYNRYKKMSRRMQRTARRRRAHRLD